MNAKIKQYIKCIESGIIKNTTLRILDFIRRKHKTTIHEMRIELKIPHQSLTGTLSGLMDYGLIYEVGQTVINNKHYSWLKYTSNFDQITHNSQIRKNAKKISWLKKIEEMNLPSYLENELINYRENIQLKINNNYQHFNINDTDQLTLFQ